LASADRTATATHEEKPKSSRQNYITPDQQSVPLKILHGALVGFGLFARGESAQIAAPAGLGIFLARVETVLSGR
jgi:hypothetical protein